VSRKGSARVQTQIDSDVRTIPQAPVFIPEDDLGYETIGSDIRKGYIQKIFTVYDERVGVNTRFGITEAVGDFYSPRHRHTFAQVRFMLDGVIAYGNDLVERGDCMYLPEGVRYGPMQPAKKEEAQGEVPPNKLFDMQFMGASRVPYHHPDDLLRARQELMKSGEFPGDGFYHREDGKRIDAWEALDENITGKKTVFLPKREEDPVIMHSGSFRWTESVDHPGVAYKYLGNFTDVGPMLLIYRVSAGSVLPSGTSPWQQVFCLMEGSIEYQNAQYDAATVGYYPPGIAHDRLVALSDATIFSVQWSPLGENYVAPAAGVIF
jgi:hypothetical protein